MHGRLKSLQKGTATVATLIALPVLGLIIGGAIQLGLLFEAKSTLNHAALQAARAGMVDNASQESLELGLARGLLPLFSPSKDLVGVGRTLVCEATPEVVVNGCIRIINPTVEAFSDFGEFVIGGKFQIPNDELYRLSTEVGSKSGVNVQDANLLKVFVTYGAPMRVPIVGQLIAATLLATGNYGEFEQGLLRKTRLPIVASATVRMQTPAFRNPLMMSRAELRNGQYCEAVDIPLVDGETEQCLIEKGATNAGAGSDCAACLFTRSRQACAKCGVAAGDVFSCFFPSVADTIKDIFNTKCS